MYRFLRWAFKNEKQLSRRAMEWDEITRETLLEPPLGEALDSFSCQIKSLSLLFLPGRIGKLSEIFCKGACEQ